MVLTALDNTLARSAVGGVDNDNAATEKHSSTEIVQESDEEEAKPTELSIIVSSDEEDSDAPSTRRGAAAKPPRPSPARTNNNNIKKQASSQQQQQQQAARRRRRRRSSARFLRLTGRFEEDDDDQTQQNQEDEDEQQQERLGEMYKRAIRMNAENRINAGNSWGLRLIENIDKFLVEDDDDDADNIPASSSSQQVTQEKRVNFTKASCTLDASVKIYSYRVDDVHLTSYKVLANLNRTETGKNKNTRNDDDGGDGEGETQTNSRSNKNTSNERRGVTETLESNIGNLNMSKLDSAFDIDPLFHKMSKTFDEGGAKGLLLVNLGVGANGCNIVFDSKEEATSIAQDGGVEEKEAEDAPTVRQEGMIDISSLTTKLDSLLGGESLESIPLVPQLKSLRQEYEQLESEGFVDHNVPKTKSRRYATSQEEEKEAEMSIHQEALERSRASQGTLAQHVMSEAGDSYAADDFGGGGDDDDDDNDFGFSDFIAADENGERYSSISFQDEAFVDDTPPGSTNAKANTTALLDAICSGEALGGNDYEFFNAATVEKLTTGNVWAGSAHWKKTEKLRKKRAAPTKKGSKKQKRKPTTKKRGYVDLSKPPCLDDVLRAAPKSKRGTDPLQLSKAAKTKHSKADNLLPPDAGIGIEQLSTLFLRPNTVLGKMNDTREKAKTVGFQDTVESFGMGFDYGGDDDSFGGDDDGPGFAFADSGDDDFVINELEGVRKVDKIQVGYATVAKKVDVKRLKKDLWNELESTFAHPPPPVENGGDVKDQDDSMEDDTSKAPETPAVIKQPKSLSFKETVADMEEKQPQGDVTLPFYFICLLHLANEKGLRLESTGLEDFVITSDHGAAPSFGTLPTETATGASSTLVVEQRERKTKEVAMYVDSDESEDDGDDTVSDSDSE